MSVALRSCGKMASPLQPKTERLFSLALLVLRVLIADNEDSVLAADSLP